MVLSKMFLTFVLLLLSLRASANDCAKKMALNPYAPTRNNLVMSQSINDDSPTRWDLGHNVEGQVFDLPVRGFDAIRIDGNNNLVGIKGQSSILLGSVATDITIATGDLAYSVKMRRVTLNQDTPFEYHPGHRAILSFDKGSLSDPIRRSLVMSKSADSHSGPLSGWTLGQMFYDQVFDLPIEGYDHISLDAQNNLVGIKDNKKTILGLVATDSEVLSGDFAYPVYARRVTLNPNVGVELKKGSSESVSFSKNDFRVP